MPADAVLRANLRFVQAGLAFNEGDLATARATIQRASGRRKLQAGPPGPYSHPSFPPEGAGRGLPAAAIGARALSNKARSAEPSPSILARNW